MKEKYITTEYPNIVFEDSFVGRLKKRVWDASEEEIQKIKDFSNPAKNPFSVDPRTEKQIKAYRAKEAARRRWLMDYRQFEKYRLTIPNATPKTFATFQKHKQADDAKYKEWQRLYREANAG